MVQQIYVVSDPCGFIGAYRHSEEAQSVIRKYSGGTKFIIQAFQIDDSVGEHVWVVPYQANDAVAFVSNSRDAAIRAQRAFHSVGLGYSLEDVETDINYWKVEIGITPPTVANRLKTINESVDAISSEGGDPETLLFSLDGNAAALVPVLERIDILRSVVSVSTGDEPAVESSADEPADEPAAEPAAEPAEEPIADEPIADEPSEEPAEEPVAAEPVAVEPSADEPAEEPAAEPVADEPAEEPAEEPAVDATADTSGTESGADSPSGKKPDPHSSSSDTDSERFTGGHSVIY